MKRKIDVYLLYFSYVIELIYLFQQESPQIPARPVRIFPDLQQHHAHRCGFPFINVPRAHPPRAPHEQHPPRSHVPQIPILTNMPYYCHSYVYPPPDFP